MSANKKMGRVLESSIADQPNEPELQFERNFSAHGRDPIDVYHVGNFRKHSANGVDRVIYSLARMLENDIGFHVVTFDLNSTSSYRFEQSRLVSIHHFGIHQRTQLILPRRFINWLMALPKNSLFHLHSVFAPLNFAVARACWQRRIPYVFTPHDSYSINSLRTRRTMKRTYLATFERRVLRNAAQIQALTPQGREEIKRYTKNTCVSLIPNFVPKPKPRGNISKDRYSLICVGRLDIFQKGLDHLLTALALAGRQTGRPFHLCLIGPGTAREITELERLVVSTGLRTEIDVVRLGALREQEKNLAVRQARFYIQLSRFEGFGLSVVEALALGTPAIVSKDVPIHKLVEYYSAGYTVETPQEAAQAIISSLSLSDAQYTQMSDAAERAYDNEFNVGKIRRGIMQMYSLALSTCRTSGQ